jgi:hypothetical protein
MDFGLSDTGLRIARFRSIAGTNFPGTECDDPATGIARPGSWNGTGA